MIHWDEEEEVAYGYNPTPPGPLPDFVTAYGAQYYISKVSFQSVFDIIQKWELDEKMLEELSGQI